MAGTAKRVLAFGAIVCLAVTLSGCGMANVSATEMALNYNFVTKRVASVPVLDPGLRFIGPFNTLLKYPKTIQTMEYDESHRDILDGRTKDGLPLILGVAFQYRLLPDRLYDLYHRFEYNQGDYLNIYKLEGIHMITELATNYTAYQFFNEKQRIADEMKFNLDLYFQSELGAVVETLQINEDRLPNGFTDSVQKAATLQQAITQTARTKDAKVVEFQTRVNNAKAGANMTVQQAIGQSATITNNARADANIIELQVTAEVGSYAKISQELNMKGLDLVKYMWYDQLSGGGVGSNGNDSPDVQMLVGVNPAAYISQGK